MTTKKDQNFEIISLLKSKIDQNESEIFELRNKMIEKEKPPIIYVNREKQNDFRGLDIEVNKELTNSTVTEKNVLNLKNDLKNFKNEMRKSLAEGESGLQARLQSINRSIQHLQN